MAKIRKIDEMTMFKHRSKRHNQREYVVTDVWIWDDPDTDGYYVNIDPKIGSDLKKLVAETIEIECTTRSVDVDKFTYIEYPDNELWVNYIDEEGCVYQCRVMAVVPITVRDMARNGIKSGHTTE